MDFIKSIFIAATGLRAQNGRMRIISENIANAQSTGAEPGTAPYRRKIPTFLERYNRTEGVNTVQLGRVIEDQGNFKRKYDPGNPVADNEGYVLLPNVDTLIEATDMRDAQRSYEANLNVIKASRQMMQRTIEILRS